MTRSPAIRPIENGANRLPTRHATGRASRRGVLVVVLLATLVVAAGCSWFSDDGPPPTMPAPPESNIPYGPAGPCAAGDPSCAGNQLLDIYRSDSETSDPRPVALWIHGGGFVGGDKFGVNAYLQPLLDDGWDIVSINYRLTTERGDNEFPTAITDAKRAVRWIRSNAAANGWDPQRIAAIGHSAGGNIVGFLVVTPDDPAFESNDLPPDLAGVSSAVSAGVALNPVADLTMWSHNVYWTDAVKRYVGCTGSCTELYDDASVQNHISASAAPLLVIFGSEDGVAPAAQAEPLKAAFESAGAGDRLEVVVVDDGPEKWLAHEPDVKRLSTQVVGFLDANTPAA